MESKFFNGAEAKKHHLPFTPRFQLGPLPSSVAKISLPPDEHQRPGHRCRPVARRGTERGRMCRWRAEDAVRVPSPAAGLPERESGGPGGKPRRAGSRRAGARRSGRAPLQRREKARRARRGRSKAPVFQPRRQRDRRRGGDPRRGGATCRAPPAAPACPSCPGCAWPGRARAAWRGPAPRSAPPARTWRGC